VNFHATVVGPAGQVYQCEHNHRTASAAVTCANSSATRRMAGLAWQRAAVQAAQAAAFARQREQQRAAAQAQRFAAQQAEAARRAAAQRAAEDARRAAAQAKAAKRAAKLAAMPLDRAWKLMTPEERLIRTAETELGVYGMILTAEAKIAYERRGNSAPVAQERQAPGTIEPWWLQPGLRS
jgi:colicin import membrane protein